MQPSPLFVIGIIIGLTVGVVLGISMGSVAFGMPAGALVSVVVGLLMTKSGGDQQ